MPPVGDDLLRRRLPRQHPGHGTNDHIGVDGSLQLQGAGEIPGAGDRVQFLIAPSPQGGGLDQLAVLVVRLCLDDELCELGGVLMIAVGMGRLSGVENLVGTAHEFHKTLRLALRL